MEPEHPGRHQVEPIPHSRAATAWRAKQETHVPFRGLGIFGSCLQRQIVSRPGSLVRPTALIGVVMLISKTVALLAFLVSAEATLFRPERVDGGDRGLLSPCPAGEPVSDMAIPVFAVGRIGLGRSVLLDEWRNRDEYGINTSVILLRLLLLPSPGCFSPFSVVQKEGLQTGSVLGLSLPAIQRRQQWQAGWTDVFGTPHNAPSGLFC
ncbi:hypothetical protein VUR80DRAFT_7598 [Thermomyces stellatus]